MTVYEKKQLILDCIRQYLKENGYPPSLREISTLSGAGSLASISEYTDMLVREGLLKRTGNRSRSLVPVDYTANVTIAQDRIRRVCLRTADGGAVELDYSITLGADMKPECVFNGILDCTRIKSPVSRIVSCRTECV